MTAEIGQALAEAHDSPAPETEQYRLGLQAFFRGDLGSVCHHFGVQARTSWRDARSAGLNAYAFFITRRFQDALIWARIAEELDPENYAYRMLSFAALSEVGCKGDATRVLVTFDELPRTFRLYGLEEYSKLVPKSFLDVSRESEFDYPGWDHITPELPAPEGSNALAALSFETRSRALVRCDLPLGELSEELARHWLKELRRVTRDSGALIARAPASSDESWPVLFETAGWRILSRDPARIIWHFPHVARLRRMQDPGLVLAVPSEGRTPRVWGHSFEHSSADLPARLFWQQYDQLVRRTAGYDHPDHDRFEREGVRIGVVSRPLQEKLAAAMARTPYARFELGTYEPGFVTNNVTGQQVEADERPFFDITEELRWLIGEVVEEIREPVGNALGAPWRIVQTMSWAINKTTELRVHTDGFIDQIYKVMLYVTPMSRRTGTFMYRRGSEEIYIDSPAGTWILFRNSEVVHSAIPPSEPGVTRLCVELTLSLAAGYTPVPESAGCNSNYPVRPWVRSPIGATVAAE